MAGSTVTGKRTEHAGTCSEVTRAEHNKVVADLELLRARLNAVCVKLDADAGVTDTNYTAGTYSSTSAISSASVLTAGLVAAK